MDGGIEVGAGFYDRCSAVGARFCQPGSAEPISRVRNLAIRSWYHILDMNTLRRFEFDNPHAPLPHDGEADEIPGRIEFGDVTLTPVSLPSLAAVEALFRGARGFSVGPVYVETVCVP